MEFVLKILSLPIYILCLYRLEGYGVVFSISTGCIDLIEVLPLLSYINSLSSSMSSLSSTYVTLTDFVPIEYYNYTSKFQKLPKCFGNKNVLEVVHLPCEYIDQKKEGCIMYTSAIHSHGNASQATYSPHRTSWLYWCMLFLLCLFRPTAADPFCDMVAAITNMQVYYNDWSCTALGSPVTNPCGATPWGGLICNGGNVVSMTFSGVALAGLFFIWFFLGRCVMMFI